MSFTVVIDPDGTSLDLSDAANGWRVAGFAAPLPELDSQFASSADTEGELRANLRYRNRQITARVLIHKSTDALLEAAENLLGQAVGRLQRDGGELRLTYPSTTTITFDVVEANMARTFDIGHLNATLAEYEVVFTCRPFGRGAQVTGPTETNNTDPVLVLDVPDVPGDVPPETVLVVTESESQNRRYVQWGAGPDVTNALIIDSDDMETSGFGGTGTTLAGAYDPDATGNSIIFSSVSDPVAVCGTGTLSHRGSFRVFARVNVSLADIQVRLVWQNNDGPFSPNPWATVPQTGEWWNVDVGLITLDTTETGAQEWSGRIDGRHLTGTGTLRVDFLALIPVDYGYGVARAVSPDVTGVVVASDRFSGTTSGGNLDARNPDVGAAWDTSGASTDFQFIDAEDVSQFQTSEAVSRSSSSASFRYGVLGSAMTDQEVHVVVGPNRSTLGTSFGEIGAILRWTDTSNYLRVTVKWTTGTFQIVKVVAGVTTTLASDVVNTFTATHSIRCTVRTSGAIQAVVDGGAVTLSASDSDLAAGGALASGKAGIIDSGDGSNTTSRWYDNIVVYTPPPEDITLYSGQTFRVPSHGRVEREDSGGTKFGKPSSWEGHRINLRPGDNRIAVRASRTDLEVSAYDTIDDELDAAIFYTPRWLMVPEV